MNRLLGKSIRICNIRMNEYNKGNSKSNAKDHERNIGHSINFDDIKILDRANNDLIPNCLVIRKI